MPLNEVSLQAVFPTLSRPSSAAVSIKQSQVSATESHAVSVPWSATSLLLLSSISQGTNHTASFTSVQSAMRPILDRLQFWFLSQHQQSVWSHESLLFLCPTVSAKRYTHRHVFRIHSPLSLYLPSRFVSSACCKVGQQLKLQLSLPSLWSLVKKCTQTFP